MTGFEIIRKEITHHKLTVAKDRVTLKLRPDCDPETERRLVTFSTEIANEIQPSLDRTLRGMFLAKDNNLFQIFMFNKSKDFKLIFEKVID